MLSMVRLARFEDLAGLLALYAQLNPETQDIDPTGAVAVWREMLARPGVDVFVADVAGVLAATCVLVVTPNLTRGNKPFALIENVVTDGRYRKQGLGRAVLEAAIAAAWDVGCYKVMLMTGSQREETLRFYEGVGFTRGKTGFQIRRPVSG